jgi:hypothetical protein
MNQVRAVLITSLAILMVAGPALAFARNNAGSWCNFEKMSARTGGNHPDYYSAQCKDGKLSIDFAIVYGTDQAQLILDLSTSEISGARTQQASKKDIAVKPPDQGGDYFPFQSHLKTIISALETMIGVAGAWGNNGIDVAKLNDALTYVKTLSAKTEALPGINKVKLNDPGQMILGLKNAVQIDYKVSATRDILIALDSAPQTYAQTRITVASGAGKTSAMLELPLTVQNAEAAFLTITLVPRGAAATGKLDEVVSPVKLEKGDQIFNLHTDNRGSRGYADNNFYAGEDNCFYTNWRVVRDRNLVVRLIDRSGRIWAEKRLSAKVGGDNSAYLTLSVPENTPRKTDEYLLVMRIVVEGGAWDQMLAEQVGDFNRRLTVK